MSTARVCNVYRNQGYARVEFPWEHRTLSALLPLEWLPKGISAGTHLDCTQGDNSVLWAILFSEKQDDVDE